MNEKIMYIAYREQGKTFNVNETLVDKHSSIKKSKSLATLNSSFNEIMAFFNDDEEYKSFEKAISD